MSRHVPYTVLEHNCDRAQKAEAEVERLREVLQEIAQQDRLDWIPRIAREALAVGGDPE